jgi:hypothetical protein
VQKTAYLMVILAALALSACAVVDEPPVSEVSAPAPDTTVTPSRSAAAPAAPQVKLHRYTVVAGDTLWDIARRFLDDPWRWRELWQDNPRIRDPHRIYPGDTIRYVEDGQGHGHITLSRRALPVVKLSPHARVEPLPPEPVPTVSKVVLDKFLVQARVVDKQTLKQAPYILGSAERRLLGGAAPDEVYAMGLNNDGWVDYAVYKRGTTYRNDGGDVLGYELVHVADAKLLRYGQPSLLRLVQTSFGVNKGDLVLPRPPEQAYRFLPQPPPVGAQGHILSVFGGIRMIGQYDSVALDLGKAEDIVPGQVFAVLQPRDAQRDPRSGKLVQGYDRRAGLLMVYQVYEHISHAVVMEARVPLRVHDLVAAP